MEANQYNTLFDTTVRRKILDGTIPIVVRIPIKSEEKFTLFNANRNEYLPYLLRNSLDEFLEEVGQTMTSITYMVNEQSIKWNTPIGVIFDNLHNGTLPMEITIGVTQNDTIFQPYENVDTLKNYHIQQLKESAYLKFNSIHVIRQLEVEYIDPLWEGHTINKLEEYEKLFNAIILPGDAWEYLPIRWYFGTQRRFTETISTITDDHLTTLHEGLITFLKQKDVTEQDPELLKLLKSSENINEIINNTVEIIIQGITIPLDTPLLWLTLNMANSDQFLHIILRNSDDVLILI
ncbi:Autophagy protein 5 [Entamoeba marina]